MLQQENVELVLITLQTKCIITHHNLYVDYIFTVLLYKSAAN